jgi:hypothetical protein
MEATLIANEFAAVEVCVVRQGRGLRLRVRDCESGAVVTLDPLDLRSFCLAVEADQRQWLRTDVYLATAAEQAG